MLQKLRQAYKEYGKEDPDVFVGVLARLVQEDRAEHQKIHDEAAAKLKDELTMVQIKLSNLVKESIQVGSCGCESLNGVLIKWCGDHYL
jgi:hypothetical protein